MARGWESKSVESQMAEFESRRAPITPVTPAHIERQRRKESLQLSRRRVVRDLEACRHPRHRKIVEESLAFLDAELAALE